MGKPTIMIFQGSPRNLNNCPNQNSKTQLLADYLIKNNNDSAIIDYCDLSIRSDGNIIQPCKGCVSTSSFHCHYPCDCYVANSEKIPDLMHNEKIYERLERADGFLVLTPVHWYSVTSQVKALFDRLVCINLTITAQEAKELGVEKNAERSRYLEKSGKYDHLLNNHYQGKTGAFLIHGDNGGVDYKEFINKPNSKPSLPKEFTKYAKHDEEGYVNDPLLAIQGLVWQCRYSGIDVPEDLIVGFHATSGVNYSEAMDLAQTNLTNYYKMGLDLYNRLVSYIYKKKNIV